jgi:RHS repeat-associated protein
MRPARMTDASANWVWDVIFTPFGATAYINQNPTVMNIRFPGQWFQLETGLAYNWHRHYDATTGRYVQPDRLGLAALLSDGPSVYAYVGGNPLTYHDPLGLWQVGATGGWGWGGASVTFGYNSGQWNFGAWLGPGAGFSASYRTGDTGCKPAGFDPSLRLSGQYQIGSFGRGGVQGVFNRSGVTVNGSWGLGGGVGVAGGASAKNTGDPDSPTAFGFQSPAPQFGWGSAAFGGLGATYYSSSCTCPNS